jgi:pimeloyl-ACP methyl ester carboxylesterase
MLEQLDGELSTAPSPAVLIGSSLGGTLAILAAGRFGARVEKLVLLDYRLMESGCWERLAPVPTRTTWHEFRVTVEQSDGERLSKLVTVHTRAARDGWRIADVDGP